MFFGVTFIATHGDYLREVVDLSQRVKYCTSEQESDSIFDEISILARHELLISTVFFK